MFTFDGVVLVFSETQVQLQIILDPDCQTIFPFLMTKTHTKKMKSNSLLAFKFICWYFRSLCKISRHLLAYFMYWTEKATYASISDVIWVSNRNKKLRQLEHKINKLHEVDPVMTHVRENCISLELECDNSTEMQAIPAKTKYSQIKTIQPPKKQSNGALKTLLVQHHR